MNKKRTTFRCCFCIYALCIKCIAQQNAGKVICTEFDEYMLTHELTPAGPVPTAFDANGVYPYMSYAETSNRPVLKKYRFIVLENEQPESNYLP